jgi:hypothetical protein
MMTELALYFCNPASLMQQDAFLQSGLLTDWNWPAATMQLERAAFESVIAMLPPSEGQRASRVYLGNEFCPYLAWSQDELLKGAQLASSAGLELTVVFAPQWESSLDRSLGLVKTLLNNHPETEVVANDWGFLAALAALSVKGVAGRLLYKAKRNPRLSRATLPTGLPEGSDNREEVLQRQLAEWALLPSDSPWLAEWLNQLATTRVEVELVPQGLKCDTENPLPLSLHVPWTYITGGGHCPVAVLKNEGATTSCARGCRNTIVEATYPTRTWPLRQAGHTVFSPMISLLKGYKELPRIDRWVLSPGLPM